jgi:alpha-L-rhamnosidase
LSKYGKADLAYQILTTPDFPSQTYVMNSGFTTWPERQFIWEEMEGPTNSLNHPMHTGFAAYFYESLGGIKSSESNPGYKMFIVNPEFPSDITNTEVSVPTPYGNIINKWNVNDGVLKMNLEVPFNTKAKVIVNSSELESLKINGQSLEDYKKQNTIEIIEGAMVIGSGTYAIQYLKS